MSSSRSCPIRELRRETRDYLQRIWHERAVNHPGMFLQGSSLFSSVLAGVVGFVLLAIVVHGLTPDSLYSSLPGQCIFTAVGLICVIYSGQKFIQRLGSNALGQFSYCDGTWNWDVRGHRVKMTEVSRVAAIKMLQHFTNGLPTKTTVQLE